ncbi:MAG: Uma2 family endonuclease, partial [Desulfamplus sp.]|nr:Uma2 family endonuclease [Desulfamplus sp.]
MKPQKKIKVTPEEYLEFDKNSEFKNEYFDGEIFSMVGARKNHNRI